MASDEGNILGEGNPFALEGGEVPTGKTLNERLWQPLYREADASTLTTDQISEIIAENIALIELVNTSDRLFHLQERYIGALQATISKFSAPKPKRKPGRKSKTYVSAYEKAAHSIKIAVLRNGWKVEQKALREAKAFIRAHHMPPHAHRSTVDHGVNRAWAREQRAMEEESKRTPNWFVAERMKRPRPA